MKRVFVRAGVILLLLALSVGPFSVVADEPVQEVAITDTIATSTPESVSVDTATTSPAVDTPVLEITASSTETEFPIIDPTTYVPGEVIVKFKENALDLDTKADIVAADTIASTLNLDTKEVIEGQNITVVTSNTPDVTEAIADLEANPNVEYAEPNYLRTLETIPNDPLYSQQWSLNTINAPAAWDLSTGQNVVVAVIDTGVDFAHPDLAGHEWDGSACTYTEGVTQIVNGGCVGGYDFADEDKTPAPAVGSTSSTHGTQVAGVIAATFNNGIGIAGIAPNVKIMALRFDLDTTSEIKAIDFAIQNGAKIINASYAGSGFSASERDAIARFEAAGGLFVAAAGNGGSDTVGDNLDAIPDNFNATNTPAYPAQHDLAGIVSVAATTQSDARASYSNFGLVSVDLGAPGNTIISTGTSTNATTSTYLTSSGTSFAAPLVAGTIALMRSASTTANASQLKAAIMNSGDPLVGLSGKTVSGKRLNAYQALLAIGATTTPPVTDTTPPTITLIGDNPMSLTIGNTFTDPGATVTDNVDATTTITGVGSVDTANVGAYTLLYSATDSAGNSASTTRTVNVNAAVSSGGGGGGGGGGGSSSSSSSSSKKKSGGGGSTTTKKVTPAPAEPSQPRVPQTTGEVLGAISYTFTLNLSLGSQGAEVTELQKKLKALGFFSGEATGYFGPMTRTAVITFQTSKGLSPVGNVGPQTRAALNSDAATSPAPVPATGTVSLEAQIVALKAQLALLLAKLTTLK